MAHHRPHRELVSVSTLDEGLTGSPRIPNFLVHARSYCLLSAPFILPQRLSSSYFRGGAGASREMATNGILEESRPVASVGFRIQLSTYAGSSSSQGRKAFQATCCCHRSSPWRIPATECHVRCPFRFWKQSRRQCCVWSSNGLYSNARPDAASSVFNTVKQTTAGPQSAHT